MHRSRVRIVGWKVAGVAALLFTAACGSQADRSPMSPSAAAPWSTDAAPTPGTTTVSYSGFNASTLTVTVNTLTTSALAPSYISEGRIQLQILVDATGKPVPCGTANATYARFDGIGGGGANPDGSGETHYAVDLDNLFTSTGGVIQNVACGDSICIRAHYVPGGGQIKVGEHQSGEAPYQVVCPSCTLGLGFWKNHYSAAWPGSVISGGMLLGTVSYTAAQLEDILNTPPAGNGLLNLAHQLITAKLNIANGVSGSTIAGAIASADALIGSLVAPPVGSGSLAPGATGALTQTLDDFNSGVTGPGACPGS